MNGWFKYMTDCKKFPDHLIYSSRKMAASRSLSLRIPGVTLILYSQYARDGEGPDL